MLPIIIKRLDANDDPLPGAYLWGGPAVTQDMSSGHVTLSALAFIEANTGDGQLFKDLGVVDPDTVYVTSAAWTELTSLGYPVIGE